MKKEAKKRINIVSVSLVKESSFLYEPRRCSSAISAYQLFAPFVENKDREHVVIAGLNTKHEPTMISVVAHWVSQSEHRCTSGNFETFASVECRFLYRLSQSSFIGSKPIRKRYSIHQKTTILLRAVKY